MQFRFPFVLSNITAPENGNRPFPSSSPSPTTSMCRWTTFAAEVIGGKGGKSVWVYHSPIGAMFIKQLPDGSYGLEYDGVVWESCPSPEIEADNVYLHMTGCADWDLLDGQIKDVPTGLSGWTPLPG